MPVDLLAQSPSQPPQDLLAGATSATAPTAPRDLLAGSSAPQAPRDLLATSIAPPPMPATLATRVTPFSGRALAAQPPGQAPLFLQEYERQVAQAPGLDRAGRQGLLSKLQNEAFGPGPQLADYAVMPHPAVQAVNAAATAPARRLTNAASNLPGLGPEWAAERQRDLAASYPAEDTGINAAAGAIGDFAASAPVLALTGGGYAIGGVGVAAGVGGARAEVSDRRAAGEEISKGQEAAYAGSVGVLQGATDFLGAKVATAAIPKLMGKVASPVAKAVIPVAGNVAFGAAENVGEQVGQNLTAQAVFGKENAPGTLDGTRNAAIAGAAGGLAAAPVSYLIGKQQQNIAPAASPAAAQPSPQQQQAAQPQPNAERPEDRAEETGGSVVQNPAGPSVAQPGLSGETAQATEQSVTPPTPVANDEAAPQQPEPSPTASVTGGQPVGEQLGAAAERPADPELVSVPAPAQAPPRDLLSPTTPRRPRSAKLDRIFATLNDPNRNLSKSTRKRLEGMASEMMTDAEALDPAPDSADFNVGELSTNDLRQAAPRYGIDASPSRTRQQILADFDKAQEARGDPLTQEDLYSPQQPPEGTPPAPGSPPPSEPPASPGEPPSPPSDPPEAPPPPPGLLDRVETWARDRLREIDEGTARVLAGVDPSVLQARRGSAGSLDPQRLVLYSVIGAAKIGKGAAKIAAWSKEMAADLGDKFTALRGGDRAKLWREARRVHALGDDERGQYVSERFTVPQAEATKTTIRRLTGQTINTGRAVTEVEALTAKLKGMARASKQGYAAAGEDLTKLKGEFTKTIRETLPPELHGKFLGEVSRIKTPAQMRVGLRKASELLADHELRGALSTVEKLTGTLKLDLPKAIRTPELTEAQAAERAGEKKVEALKRHASGEDLRSIDLTTIAEPYRTETKKLIGQAKTLKTRMKELADKGGTLEEKRQLVDDFEKVDRDLRQHVADERATREIKVGERLVHRDSLVQEVVKKLGGGKEPGPEKISNDPPPERHLVKRLINAHASVETIMNNAMGPDSDAYKVTVDAVRRGQEGYHDERRRFHQHMDGAFEAAGIAPGTRQLDGWLNTTETLKLPDVGEVPMSRNQMVGLIASAGDPETATLIERGVKWTYRANPRQDGFKLTSRDVKAIEGMLTDGERKLISAFKEYNAKEVTSRAMAAKLELSGWAPDAHEGYYPRARNRKMQEDAGLPEGWQGIRRRALENVSSMKERAPDLTQSLYVPEFVQDTSRYIEDSARLLHLALPVRTVASLWEHPKVTQRMAGAMGESMNRRMSEFLEDSMAVRVAPPKTSGDKLVSLLTRNISRAWLTMNPKTMGANVVGGTVSLLPEFDAPDLAAGVKKMFSRESYREMVDSSGIAWDRYEGSGLYSQYSPITDRRAESVANLKFPEAVKARKPGAAVDALPFLPWADSVPFVVAWESSKAWADRTMPDATPEARKQAALAKFHDATYRTQNGSSSTEVSGVASSARRHKSLLALTLFKSDANKKLNMLLRMKNADPKARAKAVAAVGLNALASSLVGFGLAKGAAELGQAIGGTEDDEETDAKMRRNFVWDTVSNIGGMAYLGDKAVDLVRLFDRQGGSFDISGPAGRTSEAFINDVLKLGKSFYDYVDKENGTLEEAEAYSRMTKAAEHAAMSTSGVAGVPLVPIYRLGKRVYNAATFEPEDPRIEQNRQATKAKTELSKRVRREVPGLEGLLRERSDLDRKGGAGDKSLTAQERARKDHLDGTARVVDRHLEALHATKDEKAAARVKESLKRSLEDPARQEIEADLTRLRRRDEAYRKGLKGLGSPTTRDAAREAVRENRMSDADTARLRHLEQIDEYLRQVEKGLQRGTLSEQTAAKRRQQFVRMAKRQAA